MEESVKCGLQVFANFSKFLNTSTVINKTNVELNLCH